MKAKKLSLAQIKVNSFETSATKLRGGMEPMEESCACSGGNCTLDGAWYCKTITAQ